MIFLLQMSPSVNLYSKLVPVGTCTVAVRSRPSPSMARPAGRRPAGTVNGTAGHTPEMGQVQWTGLPGVATENACTKLRVNASGLAPKTGPAPTGRLVFSESSVQPWAVP